MHQSQSPKWLLVLPPEGAARQVGEQLWEAMRGQVLKENMKCFDTFTYLKAFDQLLKKPDDTMSVDLMGQALVVQAFDFEATHVLIMALSPITFFTVKLLQRRGINTIHWFVEDYRQALYWKQVLPAYTHWFAIQRGPFEMECKEAKTRFSYIPTATAKIPFEAVKPWSERPVDISFVGIPSAYRILSLEALNAVGIKMFLSGPGWEKYQGSLINSIIYSKWLNSEETMAQLLQAKVGIHIPYENPQEDRAGCHVSPRVFEVLACGCALLCEESPLFRKALEEFTPAYFDGPEELVIQAKKVLSKPLSRDEQNANIQCVQKKHLYTHRFETMQSLL